MCSPDDVDGFADGIRTLLQDEQLRRKMGEVNEETMKKFDMVSVVDEMKAIYKELI